MSTPNTSAKAPILVQIYQVFGVAVIGMGALLAGFSLMNGFNRGQLLTIAAATAFLALLFLGVAQVIGYIHSIAYWTEKMAKHTLFQDGPQPSGGRSADPPSVISHAVHPDTQTLVKAAPKISERDDGVLRYVLEDDDSVCGSSLQRLDRDEVLWYVLEDDESVSKPMTTLEVKKGVRSGRYNAFTGVNRNGEGWRRIADFTNLFN